MVLKGECMVESMNVMVLKDECMVLQNKWYGISWISDMVFLEQIYGFTVQMIWFFLSKSMVLQYKWYGISWMNAIKIQKKKKSEIYFS